MNKTPFVSTANEALLGTLMTSIGDVRENRAMRSFVNTDFKWPTRNWVYTDAFEAVF